MEAAGSSQTLIHMYQTTRRYIPEGNSKFHSNCYKNYKPHIEFENLKQTQMWNGKR
jgi:hypothetical protein